MGSRLYTINNKIEYVEASKSKPLDLESPMGLMKRCNDLCVRICANTILRVTAYVDIVYEAKPFLWLQYSPIKMKYSKSPFLKYSWRYG